MAHLPQLLNQIRIIHLTRLLFTLPKQILIKFNTFPFKKFHHLNRNYQRYRNKILQQINILKHYNNRVIKRVVIAFKLQICEIYLIPKNLFLNARPDYRITN